MGGCCREAGPSLEDQPGSFEVQSAIKQLHPRLELWQIKADLSECEEVKSNRSFHLLMYEYLFRLCPQPCLYRTLTDILTAGANLSWGCTARAYGHKNAPEAILWSAKRETSARQTM